MNEILGSATKGKAKTKLTQPVLNGEPLISGFAAVSRN